LIDPFLSSIKAAGGVFDYEVIVDDTNNTSEVIDNNQLNVDVYVAPTISAEYINMRTIVTRTGVSFSEVRIA
jgi:phage tail sheath protein FI